MSSSSPGVQFVSSRQACGVEVGESFQVEECVSEKKATSNTS